VPSSSPSSPPSLSPSVTPSRSRSASPSGSAQPCYPECVNNRNWWRSNDNQAAWQRAASLQLCGTSYERILDGVCPWKTKVLCKLAIQYVTASLNLLRANCSTLPLVMDSPPPFGSAAFNQAAPLLSNSSLCTKNNFSGQDKQRFQALELVLLGYNNGLSFITGGPRPCCRKPDGTWGLTAKSFESHDDDDDAQRDSVIGGIFGGLGGLAVFLIVVTACGVSMYNWRNARPVVNRPAETAATSTGYERVNSSLANNSPHAATDFQAIL
jgi:hypothetical protein